jgi:hypothetical protein
LLQDDKYSVTIIEISTKNILTVDLVVAVAVAVVVVVAWRWQWQ